LFSLKKSYYCSTYKTETVLPLISYCIIRKYICEVNIARIISQKTFRSSGKSFAGFIVRLTTIAVALSIAVMVVSTSVIKGFRSEISDKVFGLWGHIHISNINSQRFEEVPFTLEADWVTEIKKLPEEGFLVEGTHLTNQVGGIHAFAHIPIILRGAEDIEGLMCKGIGPNFNWDRFRKYLDSGTSFAERPDGERTIMLSRITAKRLNLKVGEEVVAYLIKDGKQIPRKLRISAIYHTGLAEYDQKLAFVPLTFVQQTYGWSKDQVGGIEVWLPKIDHIDLINEHIYFDILPPELISRSIRQKLYPIFQWLELQKINEYVILILMIIICVINMATGLLILIFERTHLVGVLSAVGYSFHHIRKIFLYYAAYILGRGLLIGNGLGLGLCAIQYYFKPLKMDEESYYLSYAPVEFDLLKILLLNLGACLVILISMYIPTLIIKRMDIVKALRFK